MFILVNMLVDGGGRSESVACTIALEKSRDISREMEKRNYLFQYYTGQFNEWATNFLLKGGDEIDFIVPSPPKKKRSFTSG